MKKLVLSLLLASASLSLLAGNIYDPIEPPNKTSLTKTTGKDITDGGFFVHLVLGMPSINYGYPPNFDNDDSEYKFGVGPGLELGNMFKITDVSQHAFGVKAVWMSSMYSSFKIQVNDTLSFNFGQFQGSVLRIGPYFTVAMTDNMAMDIYYTAGVSVMFGANDASNENLGLTHNFGIGYRVSVLSVGLDYNFGAIKAFNNDFEIPASQVDDYKVRTTHLRLFVGVKI